MFNENIERIEDSLFLSDCIIDFVLDSSFDWQIRLLVTPLTGYTEYWV